MCIEKNNDKKYFEIGQIYNFKRSKFFICLSKFNKHFLNGIMVMLASVQFRQLLWHTVPITLVCNVCICSRVVLWAYMRLAVWARARAIDQHLWLYNVAGTKRCVACRHAVSLVEQLPIKTDACTNNMRRTMYMYIIYIYNEPAEVDARNEQRKWNK